MSNTLDLVLRQAGGALQFPVPVCASILGISPITIRNRKSLGTLGIPYTTINTRIYFSALDVANYLDAVRATTTKNGGAP